uniref:Uncharacterized protein n=1 Tax=Ditylenchus dipsaci TaxID=166011 RepID=A0A915DVX8_9BILA
MQSRLCSIQSTCIQMKGIPDTLIQAISYETQHAEVIAAKKQIANNAPLAGNEAYQNFFLPLHASSSPQLAANQTADGSSVQVRGFGYANTVEGFRIASNSSQHNQPSTSNHRYTPHSVAPVHTIFAATTDYLAGSYITGAVWAWIFFVSCDRCLSYMKEDHGITYRE